MKFENLWWSNWKNGRTTNARKRQRVALNFRADKNVFTKYERLLLLWENYKTIKSKKKLGLFHINRINKAGFFKLKLITFYLIKCSIKFFKAIVVFQKFTIFILANYGVPLKYSDSNKTFRNVLRGLQTSPHLILPKLVLIITLPQKSGLNSSQN